jgi:hypothetical protein
MMSFGCFWVIPVLKAVNLVMFTLSFEGPSQAFDNVWLADW